MKTIDSHTHFYPEFVAARPAEWAHSAGENYWALLVGKRPDGRKSLQGFPSEKKFLCDMDKAGVERAIIQGWYWQNSGTCEMMNYEISKFVKAHPDRLSAFISIQPANAERSIEAVKRARDDGFCGIGEIHDGVQQFEFLSPQFDDICAAAAECELPICVHITESSERKYLGKVPTRTSHAVEAARANPSTNFIFAHWCGGEIFSSPQTFTDLPNAYFDSAASPLTNDDSAWGNATNTFPEKTVYGSDYPLRLYPSKFSEEEMQTIAQAARTFSHADSAAKFLSENILKITSI